MTTVTVRARVRWNDTGIDVTAGQEVVVSASGEWDDSGIRTDPGGFERPWLNPLRWTRRDATSPWFALVAAIGKFDGPYYRIGSGARFTARRDGRLYLFANDAWLFYFNNRGSITAVVETE